MVCAHNRRTLIQPANAPLAGATRALRWATPTQVFNMLGTGQNIALDTEERQRDYPRRAIDDHIAKHRGCNTEDDGGTSGEWR